MEKTNRTLKYSVVINRPKRLSDIRESLTTMFWDDIPQPAGRLVRDCAIRRYGIGPTFFRPQSARDGTAWTREILSPRRVGTGRDGTYTPEQAGVRRFCCHL
ncbi:hypothetical protein YC2023_005111 [Brassica napus]